jgi:capsular polysaccharide biosynthesis protein
VDVNDLFKRLLPRFWLILALVVLGGAAGLAFSRFSPSVYRAEARVLVGQTAVSRQVDYSDLLASQLLAQTYADLAGTAPVLQAAGAALNPPASAADLAPVVSSRAPVQSIYVLISAQAGDADRAAAIANAVGTALVARAPAETAATAELQTAIASDLKAVDGEVTATLAQIGALSARTSPTPDEVNQLATLQTRLETLRSQRAALAAGIPGPGSNVLTLVDPAATPREASGPRTVVNLAVGALLGAVAGIAFALLRSRDELPTETVIARVRGRGRG